MWTLTTLLLILAICPNKSSANPLLLSWLQTKPHPKIYQNLVENKRHRHKLHLQKILMGFTPKNSEFVYLKFGKFIVYADPEHRHPTVIINTSPLTNYIIQAPHASFERHTKMQAAELLLGLDARAAIISGSHRCSSTESSPCSGKTRVCSEDRRAYPISDSAHNTDHMFQVYHELLADFFVGSKIVQLHQMRSSNDDVKLILSTGAKQKRDSGWVSEIRDKLKRVVKNARSVVSCNSIEDQKRSFRKLCGYTNTQARYLGNSHSACLSSVELDSNRFLHIEQDFLFTKKSNITELLIEVLSQPY